MKKRTPSASDNKEQPIAEVAKALSKPTVAPKSAGKKAPVIKIIASKPAAKLKVAKTPPPVEIPVQLAETRPESAPKVPPRVKAKAEIPPAKAVAKKSSNREKKGSAQGTDAIISAPLSQVEPSSAGDFPTAAPSKATISAAPLTKGEPSSAGDFPTTAPSKATISAAPLIKVEPSLAGDFLPAARETTSVAPLTKGEPSSAGDLLSTTPTEAATSGKAKKSSKKGAKATPVAVQVELPQIVAPVPSEILPPPRKVILPPRGFEDTPKVEQKQEVKAELAPDPQPEPIATVATTKSGKKKPSKKESKATISAAPLIKGEPSSAGDFLLAARETTSAAPLIKGEPSSAGDFLPAAPKTTSVAPLTKVEPSSAGDFLLAAPETTSAAALIKGEPSSAGDLLSIMPTGTATSGKAKKSSKKGAKATPVAVQVEPPEIVVPSLEILPPPRKVILPPRGFEDTPKVEQKQEVKAELEPQPEPIATVATTKSGKKKPSKKGSKASNEVQVVSAVSDTTASAPLTKVEPSSVGDSPTAVPSKATISVAPLTKVEPSSAGDFPTAAPSKATISAAPLIKGGPSSAGDFLLAARETTSVAPLTKGEPSSAGDLLSTTLTEAATSSKAKKSSKKGAKATPIAVQVEPPQIVAPVPSEILPPPRKVILPPRGFEDTPKVEQKQEVKAELAPDPQPEPIATVATTKSGKKKPSKKGSKASNEVQVVSAVSDTTASAPLIKVEPSSAGDFPTAAPSKATISVAPLTKVEPSSAGDFPTAAPSKATTSVAPLTKGEPSSAGDLLSTMPTETATPDQAKKSSKKGAKATPVAVQVEPPQIVAPAPSEILPPPRKVILPPRGFEDTPKVEQKQEVKAELAPDPQPEPIATVATTESGKKKHSKKGSKVSNEVQVISAVPDTTASAPLIKGESSSAGDFLPAAPETTSVAPLIKGEPSSAGDLLSTTPTEAVISGKTKKSSKKGAKSAPVAVQVEPPQIVALAPSEILPPPRKVILPPPGFEEKVEPKVETIPILKSETLPVTFSEIPDEKGGKKKGKSNKAGNKLSVALETTARTTETTVAPTTGGVSAKGDERYIEPTPDELYELLNELELRRIAAQSEKSASVQTSEPVSEQQAPESETNAAQERRESRSARRRRKWLEKRQLLREQQVATSAQATTEQQTSEPENSTASVIATEVPKSNAKLKNQRGQKGKSVVTEALTAVQEPANSEVSKPQNQEVTQPSTGEKTGKNRRNKKKKPTSIAPEAVILPEKTPEAPVVLPQKRIIEVPQFARPSAELIAPVPIEKPAEKDGRKFGSKKAKAAAGGQSSPNTDKPEQSEVLMPQRRDDKRDNRQRTDAPKIEIPAPLPPPRRKKQTKVYNVHKNRNLPSLPDELMPIIESVDKFMQGTLFIPDEASIVIGVSGGVDSVAMLDIIANISHKRGYQITVAHCNHGLRGNESDADEKLVRALAGSYRAQYRNTKFNVPEYARKNRTSVENAARMLRYQFFERTARSVGARFVLTAHNADDAAETLLLNLLRGSGLTGLAGMPPRRDLAKKIHLVRPLLQLPKERLRNYAMKRPLEWREDSSNASKLFMRNKIRHDLLPKLRDEYTPAIADILVRTTRILQGAEAVVSERVEQISATMVRQTGNEIRLDTAFFDTVNDFLKGEIIQSIIRKLGAQPVSMNTIDRVIALAGSEIHAECRITGAITAIRDRSDIVFTTAVSAEVYTLVSVGETTDAGVCVLRLAECAKKDIQLGGNSSVEFFDAAMLPKQLTLRTWREGDSFRPLGLGGSMKISDFLTNIKISATERKRVLVLCAGSEIIWVCGKRISDTFKITPATKHIIRAEIILPQQLGDEPGAAAHG